MEENNQSPQIDTPVQTINPNPKSNKLPVIILSVVCGLLAIGLTTPLIIFASNSSKLSAEISALKKENEKTKEASEEVQSTLHDIYANLDEACSKEKGVMYHFRQGVNNLSSAEDSVTMASNCLNAAITVYGDILLNSSNQPKFDAYELGKCLGSGKANCLETVETDINYSRR